MYVVQCVLHTCLCRSIEARLASLQARKPPRQSQFILMWFETIRDARYVDGAGSCTFTRIHTDTPYIFIFTHTHTHTAFTLEHTPMMQTKWDKGGALNGITSTNMQGNEWGHTVQVDCHSGTHSCAVQHLGRDDES